MVTFTNALLNPCIPPHFLLQPIKDRFTAIQEECFLIKKVYEDFAFLRKYEDRIPSLERSSEMTPKESLDFQILITTSQSDRPCLRGRTFGYFNKRISGQPTKVVLSILTLTPEAKRPTSMTISQDLYTHIAILIYRVAIGIITTIVVLPVAGIGILGKKIYCYLYNPYRKPLFITQIPKEQYPEFGRIAREWQKIAGEKVCDREASTDEIFQSCSKISRLVAECFESSMDIHGLFHEAYVCKDEVGNPQGFLLLAKGMKRIKIAHIVTHPHNIRDAINKEEFTRVEGVGSAMIAFAAKYALDRHQSLYLEGIDSAKLFYEKQGFVFIRPQDIERIQDGDYAMQMTVDHIRRLYPQYAA